MHIAEGVLDVSTLLAAAGCTAFGLSIGLRRLTPQTLPTAALFAAVFFVVGTIHIPIGVGSVHLTLNGSRSRSSSSRWHCRRYCSLSVASRHSALIRC
jgi:ABC-type Co2+ transport system permease subunit